MAYRADGAHLGRPYSKGCGIIIGVYLAVPHAWKLPGKLTTWAVCRESGAVVLGLRGSHNG